MLYLIFSFSVQRQQRKYLLAAHEELFKDGEKVIKQNPAPEPTPSQESDMTQSQVIQVQ